LICRHTILWTQKQKERGHLNPHTPPHLAGSLSSSSGGNIVGSTSRVGHGTGEANGSVEEVSSALVAGSSGRDLCFGVLAKGLGSSVGIANVGQLVAEGVGDDVGVQGLSLTAAGYGVSDLEGEFGGGTVAFAALEGDGGCAFAKVSGSSGGSTSSCGTGVVVGVASVVVGVASVVVTSVVVTSVVVTSVVVGVTSVVVGVTSVVVGVASVVVTSVVVTSVVGVVVTSVVGVVVTSVVGVASIVTGISSCGTSVLSCVSCISGCVACIASCVTGASVTSIALCLTTLGLVCVSGVALVCVASVAASRRASSSSLRNNKIAETSRRHEVEDTHAISSKGSTKRLLAEGSSGARSIDSRVDKGSDTTELRGGRERSVAADILGVAVREGVGVLLSSNKTHGSSNGICASTKLSHDLIGTGKLWSCQY
jgi:hypothetical protein